MYAAGFMALLVWVCGSVLFYEFEKEPLRPVFNKPGSGV